MTVSMRRRKLAAGLRTARSLRRRRSSSRRRRPAGTCATRASSARTSAISRSQTAATSAVAIGMPAHASTSLDGLRVGPAEQLGREVGERRLVGLDGAVARQVDAARGRPVGGRLGARISS